MKKYDELRSTTSNKIYRRLLINETRCGYCGLGSGCNKEKRRKCYYRRLSEGNLYKQRLPNWKLMSKYKKQYQKPRLKEKYSTIWGGVEFYDIVW